ncbi:MAG: hypothetical protein PWR07_1258 [Bacillota bacterium]|nr:hypothetical protein [Bacillota bacterium]
MQLPAIGRLPPRARGASHRIRGRVVIKAFSQLSLRLTTEVATHLQDSWMGQQVTQDKGAITSVCPSASTRIGRDERGFALLNLTHREHNGREDDRCEDGLGHALEERDGECSLLAGERDVAERYCEP